MGRTRLAKASIVGLREKIRVAKERKEYFERYLRELLQDYLKDKISREFYLKTEYKKFDGKTIREWIVYYDNYIKECGALINKYQKDVIKGHFLVIFISAIIISLLAFSFYQFQPALTGFFVQEPVALPEAISEANAAISTIQHEAILGQPVKWTKTISLDEPATAKIILPAEATNISVNKISYSEQEGALPKEDSSPSQEELLPSETGKQEAEFSITGAVISETGEGGFLTRFFRNIGRLTGGAIGIEPEIATAIKIQDNATNYEITYETPAPYSVEEEIGRGKRIKIIGPETIHYENVLAFTNLNENLNIKNPSKIKIHWIENDTYISASSVQDTDNNGIYDYVSWIAPTLSEQTFEIIVITKAEHLDNNRRFISDIYEEVRALDDIWSETIPSEDYVRVVFERNLTPDRDITIYPRTILGNPRIEVYEIDETIKIAEFTSLNSNQYNKIFLTNLQGSQDTFDLRVSGGSIEFDHIIDPSFPIVAASATSSRASNDFADVITMPAGIASGDLLIVIHSTDVGGGARTWSGGFTEILNKSATSNLGVAWKIAVGGDTLTVTKSESERFSAIALRITGAHASSAPEISATVTGSSTAPNPDSVTASWGAENNLFIAFHGHDTTTTDASVTAFPTSYTENQIQGVYVASAGEPNMATQNLTAASDDPGTFTINTSLGWRAGTIVVRPAAAGGDAINPVASFGTNPADNVNRSNSSVTFELKAFDDTALSYLRLYGNWTGSWIANQTNTSPINDTYWNITVDAVPNGKYIWAAWANDSSGNSAFSTTNRTITIDTVAPVIILPFYVNGTKKTSTSDTLTLNISVTDATTSTSACKIDINGTNQTVTVSSGWCNITNGFLTNLASGNRTINVYANDSTGQFGLNNSFVVQIDTTSPVTNFYSPDNNTFSNNSTRIFVFNQTDNINLKNSTLNIWDSNGVLIDYNSTNAAFIWSQVGNNRLISGIGAGGPALAGLNSTRVAFIDSANDRLSTYNWNGTDWSQVGNNLSITGGTPALASLNLTRVAFIDSANDNLSTYNWNGTDWSRVGNNLPIAGVGASALAGLNSTRVAFIDETNEQLRTYNWNGTDWSQAGNSLSISLTGAPALASLNSTRVAFIDDTNDNLRTYNWNGTDWSLVGNSLSILLTGAPALASLNSTRVAFIDDTNDNLRTYNWNGTDWSQIGNSLSISGVSAPALAGLNSTRVAFIDTVNEQLRTYKFSGIITSNITGTSNSTSWDNTFSSDGVYLWNAETCDEAGNCAFNSTNRTITIDTVAPAITIPFYANATIKASTETLTLNISVTDAGTSPSACKIDANGTNQTVSVSSGWCNITNGFLTNLAEGNRTINVYANDSTGQFGLNNSYVVKIVNNAAPTIPFVLAVSAQDPLEAGYRSVLLNFSVNDTDGSGNINLSSARARFNRTGESNRENFTCANIGSGGNGQMFTCNVSMYYFDELGVWTINVSARDNSEASAENSTTNFTFNLLTAMVLSPSALTWPSQINLTNTNITATNNPITINNTGNALNLSINATAYNLRGETTTTQFIFANNFTIGNVTDGCGAGINASTMVNATSRQLNGTNFSKGNNSLNYGNQTSGQEQIFFCLRGVPQDITAQSYSSSFYGSWEIRVLLAALIPGKKRKREKEGGKKKVEDDRLIKLLGLVMDELKEEYSLNKREMVRTITEKLKEKYKVSKKEILEVIKEELCIPVTIFSKKLGALESITKYMKENLNMNYREIGKELGRNERTIWTAYKKATEKQKGPFEMKKAGIMLPISTFENKELTVLESVIVCLKERGLKFSEIAELLERDQRNIWTAYSRAKRKQKNRN